MEPDDLPVAVLGAGPVGLAAAAHLADRGLPFVVLEAGPDAAASVQDWAHVHLFSPWRYNIDPTARRLLNKVGWSPPDPGEHPTGGDLVDHYLRPLAALPDIAGRLRLAHRAVAVGRAGRGKVGDAGRVERPLVVAVDTPTGRDRVLARAVIDATGTWQTPNPMGGDGYPALGEPQAADRVTYGIPDVSGQSRHRYAGRRVALVGSGHSAQHVVRALASLRRQNPATEITWLVRRREPGQMFGSGSDDQLPERGRLGAEARRLVDAGQITLLTGFSVDQATAGEGAVWLTSLDGRQAGPFDRVVVAAGFRPDLGLLRELRVEVDPVLESARALAPMIDPNLHSCGTVPAHGEAELRHPEPGLYLVGAKSYGRAPTFLLATGYEQVRSVVAHLAGDADAARQVRRVLPATDRCGDGCGCGGV